MQSIRKLVQRIDAFQQRHTFIGFVYAVVKKYGEDNTSYYGAIITYYAFLALFPLLFALTAGLHLLFRGNVHLQASILDDANRYFPLIGSELQRNVTSVGKTGLTLAFSALVAVYGARGVADALRLTLDHAWRVPLDKRAGFPKNMFKSLGMVVCGGGLLLAAAVLSSYATSLGHSAVFKIASTCISLCVIMAGLFLIFRLGVSLRKISSKGLLLSAAIAAIGLQILQTFGGYLITHELKQLNTPYGAFAVTLALLFWIYLQVEVALYAIEAGVVKSLELWPRRIDENSPANKPRHIDKSNSPAEPHRAKI